MTKHLMKTIDLIGLLQATSCELVEQIQLLPGGITAVMNELKAILNLDSKTVAGKPLAKVIAEGRNNDREVLLKKING